MKQDEKGYYTVQVGLFKDNHRRGFKLVDDEVNEEAFRKFSNSARYEGVRVELGIPTHSDKAAWADRVTTIDENRVCGIIRSADLSVEGNGGTLKIEPIGPLKEVARILLENDDATFAIRALMKDSSTLSKVVTYDLIQPRPQSPSVRTAPYADW